MIRGGRADLYFEAFGPRRAAALGKAFADHICASSTCPRTLSTRFRGLRITVFSRAAAPVPMEAGSKRSIWAPCLSFTGMSETTCRPRDAEGPDRRTARFLPVAIPAWRDYAPNPYEALKTRGVPMHPAAAAFFREHGWTAVGETGTGPAAPPETAALSRVARALHWREKESKRIETGNYHRCFRSLGYELNIVLYYGKFFP